MDEKLMKIIDEVMRHTHNWFFYKRISGEFRIYDGCLEIQGLSEGQFFRIIGSVFNDGLYQYPACDLTDEEFHGDVWALAVPTAFIDLCEEICEWIEKNEAVTSAPYASESFGGYSYTLARNTASDGATTPLGWQSVYRSRLNTWRKMQ